MKPSPSIDPISASRKDISNPIEDEFQLALNPKLTMAVGVFDHDRGKSIRRHL